MSFEGRASGKLRFESSGRLAADVILAFHPELKSFLDEVVRQGWKFLYIDTKATALAETEVQGVPYSIYSAFDDGGHGMGPSGYVIQLQVGPTLPKIVAVSSVEEFRINVSTKDYPRAATVDISNGTVLYIHDAFWRWERGWEQDERKLSSAKEVYAVAKWLLEEKKLKLSQPFELKRYEEISALLKDISSQ
jgi:hypothetical protein